jgi:hypothetical protein
MRPGAGRGKCRRWRLNPPAEECTSHCYGEFELRRPPGHGGLFSRTKPPCACNPKRGPEARARPGHRRHAELRRRRYVVAGAVNLAVLKERIEAAPRRPLDQGGWSAISSFRRPVQSPYCNGAGSPAWGVARGAGSSLSSLEELPRLHHLNPVTMFRTAPQGLSKQAEGRT